MGLLYKFPGFYEDFVGKFVFTPEVNAFFDSTFTEMLHIGQLKSGAVILELACGTGKLALQLAEQRADIAVIGVDQSADMIAAAYKSAQDKGLTNVHFIQKDALALTAQDVHHLVTSPDAQPPFDLIVCSFGFSAMKLYRPIILHSLTLLRQNGTIVISDIRYTKRTWDAILAKYLIDGLLFGADSFRDPWLVIKENTANFMMHELPIKSFGTAMAVYVAKGIKPTATKPAHSRETQHDTHA